MEKQPERLNQWLVRICAVLIVIDLLHIPLGLASIPRYYQRVSTLTIPVYGSGIGNVLTNEGVLAEATARGMTLSTFAIYLMCVQLVASLVFTLVGSLVLWRARHHWFGWFTAHVMLFLNSYGFYIPEQVALLVPGYLIDLGSVFWPTFLLYLFLFPNGRVVPKWMRWPIILYTVIHFALQIIGVLVQSGFLTDVWFESIMAKSEGIILGVFVLVIGSQLYRYIRISNAVERAQTRWFISGIVFLIGVPTLAGAVGLNRFEREWGILGLAIIPITLAVAILRYHLWDIDVIIRKTVQYGVFTAVLALVYFGTIILLQTLVGQATGEQSPIIIVLSTLLIAALFSPLRRRVQTAVDRRFYRQKYDAQQVLAQFAQTARDEVEMDKLTAELLHVIQQTMQPDHMSLWLPPNGQRTGQDRSFRSKP